MLKKQYNNKTIGGKMLNKKVLPKLDFNVTNRCNLRCTHCCFRSGEIMIDNEFSMLKIQSILKDFIKLGGKRIDITGGEPLMRPDIYEIIFLSKKLGLNTELVTNSLLLREEKIMHLKDLGLDQIAISLDGSNHSTHGEVRGIKEPDYIKVLDNIKKCAKLDIYTKINTVVFDSNLVDLENITKLAIDLGASEHGFYFFSPIGRGKIWGKNVADPLEWLKVIREKLIKYKDLIKLSLEVPIIEIGFVSHIDKTCFLQNPWHLQILPNGNVFPCAILAAYDLPIGNLYESKLKSMWEADELWDETYYKKYVQPYMSKYKSCVNYSSFRPLIESGKYKFICLCKKLKIEEVCGNDEK